MFLLARDLRARSRGWFAKGWAVQVSSNVGTVFNYTGPNQAQVAADNQKAVADGMSGGFSMADILTDNDKKLTGWQPSGQINQTAIALANYRYSGAITGEVTPKFVDALKTAIADTGSYPANPAALLKAPSPNAAALAPDTFSALMGILGG